MVEVALQHSLNANLVHKWIRATRQRQVVTEAPAFISILMASDSMPVVAQDQAAERIRLTLPRPNGVLVVEWPVSVAEVCRSLIRDLVS